jgi:hypothetical protein
MGRACGTHDGATKAYRILVEKSGGKKPFGRLETKYRILKMDLKEKG